jgi:predicted RND superfamily exporter protein
MQRQSVTISILLLLILLPLAGIALCLNSASVNQSPTLNQMLTAADLELLQAQSRRFPGASELVIVAVPAGEQENLVRLEASLEVLDGVAFAFSSRGSPSLPLRGLEAFSGDATAELIVLGVEAQALTLDAARALNQSIEARLSEAQIEGVVVGLPRIRHASWQVARDDARIVLPVLVALTVAVTLGFFGSLVAVGLSLALTCLTTLTCLLLQLLLYDSLPALIVIVVPVIWAIATLDAFHLYSRSVQCARDPDPAGAAARAIFGPCLFTSLTTAVCLASLAWFETSPMIASFGLLTAVGTLIAFALTFTVGVAIVRRLGDMPDEPRWPAAVARSLASGAERYAGAVILIWGVVLLLALPGWQRIGVSSAYPAVFSAHLPIAADMRRLAQMTGSDLNPIEIVIEPVTAQGREPDALAHAALLVHNYLTTIDETRLTLPLGLLDTEELEAMAASYRAGETDLPEDEAHAALIDQWVATDREAVRVHAFLAPTGFLRKREILEWLAKVDRTMLGNHRLSLSGPGYLYHLTEERGVRSLVRSSVVSLLCVLAVLWYVGGSLRSGLGPMAGATLPAAILGGFMGWVGIPWSIALLPLPALLLGLMNDDAIHMGWGLRSGRQGTLEANAQRAGPALIATTTLLAGAVGSLCLSGIATNQFLGLLVPLGLVLALLCNLTLLPALNSWLRR